MEPENELIEPVAPDVLYAAVGVHPFDDKEVIVETSDRVTSLCGTEPATVYEYKLVRKLQYEPTFKLTPVE